MMKDLDLITKDVLVRDEGRVNLDHPFSKIKDSIVVIHTKTQTHIPIINPNEVSSYIEKGDTNYAYAGERFLVFSTSFKGKGVKITYKAPPDKPRKVKPPKPDKSQQLEDELAAML